MREMTQPKHEKADPTSNNLQGGDDAAKANTESPTVSDSSNGRDGGDGSGDWASGLKYSAENRSIAEQLRAQQAADKDGASAERMSPPDQKKPED